LFVPSNETQQGLFQENIKYFLEKQRAGVVSLKKYMLYLLPPCEQTYQIHKISPNEILGVFVDNTDIGGKPNQSNDQRRSLAAIDDIDVSEVLPLLENPDIAEMLNH